MKNMEEPKLNSEKIWKIQKEIVKRYEKYGKKSRLNSEMICKIWKKIVKRYGNYERKMSWVVKRFGEYRRKLWKDMENTEEKCVE